MARPSSSKAPKVPITQAEPLLTKENFEKELKALAAKAQEETWSKWAIEQFWVLAQAATLLGIAAVYSNVSELTLSPVYGGIPSSRWHSKGVMTACFLGWSSNLFIRRHLPLKPKQLLPLIAAYIPITQFFLLRFSSFFTATYGPIITESLTFLPLLLLSVSCTATTLDGLDMPIGRWQWLSDAMPGVTSYTFFKVVEYLSGQQISSTIGNSIFQTRMGLQVCLSALYMALAPSKLLLFTIPAILHTLLLNTHTPTPYALSSLNSSMAKTGWSILDRHESLTGYVSIIENIEDGFRVMRCDHSLLGGEWHSKKGRNELAEPIYSIFVMLEAVRLVKVQDRVPDNEAKALVIGLGIGTTPSALIAHGLTTTIVEIDPIVHTYATKYFALPTNHKKVIQDAVSYASEIAKTDEKYDYIVHDVFTGGAEPVDLFTLEFLRDLEEILKPGGVIAINYASNLLLPSTKTIISTILTVFPTCRLFRESAPPTAEKIEEEGQDFINMVVFCLKPLSPTSPQTIEFRQPTEKDFLKSGARRRYLLPRYEVKLEEIGISKIEKVVKGKKGKDGVVSEDVRSMVWGDEEGKEVPILTGGNKGIFKEWHEESALGHWKVMRTVIPGEIWELW